MRKVVNHQLGENKSDTLHSDVRCEGRISHVLLRSLDLWGEVEDDQLAHAAPQKLALKVPTRIPGWQRRPQMELGPHCANLLEEEDNIKNQ